MDVLMFSPGYPAEMPYFTRGLAEVGARVWGIGDQPAGALPDTEGDLANLRAAERVAVSCVGALVRPGR